MEQRGFYLFSARLFGWFDGTNWERKRKREWCVCVRDRESWDLRGLNWICFVLFWLLVFLLFFSPYFWVCDPEERLPSCPSWKKGIREIFMRIDFYRGWFQNANCTVNYAHKFQNDFKTTNNFKHWTMIKVNWLLFEGIRTHLSYIL